MEVMEAFEALGLEEPDELSAEQLKRSYLRKVRQHPPERDPEGFQRVRQAYELLQGRAGNWRLPTRAAESASFSPRSSPSSSEPASPTPAAPSRDPEPVLPTGLAATQIPTPVGYAPPLIQSDALARLRAALDQSKWVVAANALLELYGDPSLYDRLPPPEIALRISLELFENGKHKTARRLFEGFASHMASHGTRLSAETVSIWKLLSELSELSRAVDAPLTCALAEAIRSGGFQDAASEVRAEMKQYGESKVTALMQSRAPTLFAATWPYVRPFVLRKKRIGLPWKIQLSLFAAFALFRVIVSLTEPPSQRATAPAAAVPLARPERRFSEPSSVLSAPDASKLQDITSKVEKLYQSGLCDETRVEWDRYLSVARPLGNAPAVRQGYANLRSQVVNVCPLLATELPEEP